MFDGVIGKIILFWIFMIGAMFFARMLGLTGDTKTTIIYMLACAFVYFVWVAGRTMAKRRREEAEYMSSQRKGGTGGRSSKGGQRK